MTAKRTTGLFEFIALMAALMATVAFSIDAMLPAFPVIIQELTPDAPNNVQMMITLFMLGMGIGTLIVGPLSDAFGRKRTMVGCGVLYAIGALVCWQSGTLEWLLAGRVIMGLGAAGPRVVSIAMVRDMYAGRDMARVVSFIMMTFMIFPAVAPMIGSGIIALSGWRSLFFVFVIFALITGLWLTLRQNETLAVENRRPLDVAALARGMGEVLRNRIVVISMIAQGFVIACMFSTISSIQQIFEVRFDAAASFPYWFALIALVSAVSSFVNARLVMTIGMRALITFVVAAQAVISAGMALTNGLGLMPEGAAFTAQILWTMTMFATLGLSVGNLNALALEPLGRMAGLGASVIGCFSTIMGVVLATPVGRAFDGTNVPLAVGISLFMAAAFILMTAMPKRH